MVSICLSISRKDGKGDHADKRPYAVVIGSVAITHVFTKVLTQ